MSQTMTPLEIRLSDQLKAQAALNVQLSKKIERLEQDLRTLSPGTVRIPMTTLEHESARSMAERGIVSNRRIEGGQ